MPYVDPNQNVAVWANQTLFKDFLTPKTTTGATAPATTPSTTVAIPGGPEFKTPTASELAANQNAYSTAALGAYGGIPIIQQQLTGQLPRDVQANINQMGAERGIATGMPGSPNANAATMKALGLTSLGLQQQGLENLNAAYRTFPQLNPLGISQQNLEAWRTGTQYQEQALSQNARAALEWELNQIRANTALTQQQREYAMQQARNKAYASALQPYLDQFGQPMTTTTTAPATTATPGWGEVPTDLNWGQAPSLYGPSYEYATDPNVALMEAARSGGYGMTEFGVPIDYNTYLQSGLQEPENYVTDWNAMLGY